MSGGGVGGGWHHLGLSVDVAYEALAGQPRVGDSSAGCPV